MNVDRVEIILLMKRGASEEIDGAPIYVEFDSNLFAVKTCTDCVLIGAISEQSQIKCDMHGGDNFKIQRGTHSAPCSFNDLIELFGPDLSKLRLIDARVATLSSKNQFEIPRMGKTGFVVEATVDLPKVGVSGLNGKFSDELLRLIAMEAVADGVPPKRKTN